MFDNQTMVASRNFGACVVSSARALKRERGIASELAERAIAACGAEEKTALAMLAEDSTFPGEHKRGLWATVRLKVKEEAVQALLAR